MRYVLRTGMGGVKQVCAPVVNKPGEYAVLASVALGPEQRLFVDALRVGLVQAGHQLYKDA